MRSCITGCIAIVVAIVAAFCLIVILSCYLGFENFF